MNDHRGVPRRLLALATALAVLLTACTASTTSGHHGSAASTGKTGGIPAPSSSTPAPSPSTSAPAPAPPKPRITNLTSAWTWEPLGAVKVAFLTTLNSVAVDDNRAYSMGEVAKKGADLTDYPSRISAADLKTGRSVWSVTLPGSNIAMLVLPNVIVVAVYDHGPALAGLDPATGRKLWERHDLGSDDTSPVVTLGGSLYATIDSHSFDGVARLDPATGKVTARSGATVSYAALLAGTDALIADDGDHLIAFAPDLRTKKWVLKGTGSTTDHTDRIVGDVLLRIPQKFTKTVRVQGLSVTTGRHVWTRAINYEEGRDDISIVDGLVVFHSGDRDVLTAVDPARGGRIVWQKPTQYAQYVGPAADTGNLLACGLGLVSAESSTAGLYHVTDLPKRGFGSDGCVAAPVETAKSSVRPGLVVVASPSAVDAYSATTTNSPHPALDPVGRWGRPDPSQCGLDATTTHAALTAHLGGTWTLTGADASHDCEWRSSGLTPRLTVQAVPLASRKAARKHINPRNVNGGCVRLAAGGSVGRIIMHGLPAGSGACYLTHYTDSFSGRLPDAVTGVSVRAGHYFAVLIEGFKYGTVRAAHGPQKIYEVLYALTH